MAHEVIMDVKRGSNNSWDFGGWRDVIFFTREYVSQIGNAVQMCIYTAICGLVVQRLIPCRSYCSWYGSVAVGKACSWW